MIEVISNAPLNCILLPLLGIKTPEEGEKSIQKEAKIVQLSLSLTV